MLGDFNEVLNRVHFSLDVRYQELVEKSLRK